MNLTVFSVRCGVDQGNAASVSIELGRQVPPLLARDGL